jgi:hypothetical protein
MRGVLALAVVAGCGFSPSGSSGGAADAAAAGADASLPPDLDAGPEPTDAAPAVTCESPWVDDETGCHLYVKDVTATFDAAQADCQARGGHLVVENKPGEFDEVAAGMGPLGEADRFWIGLHDPPPDDNVFVWVNGLALEDPHWAGTEPSNSGDCVNARPDGTWGDRNCIEAKIYACEKND